MSVTLLCLNGVSPHTFLCTESELLTPSKKAKHPNTWLSWGVPITTTSFPHRGCIVEGLHEMSDWLYSVIRAGSMLYFCFNVALRLSIEVLRAAGGLFGTTNANDSYFANASSFSPTDFVVDGM